VFRQRAESIASYALLARATLLPAWQQCTAYMSEILVSVMGRQVGHNSVAVWQQCTAYMSEILVSVMGRQVGCNSVAVGLEESQPVTFVGLARTIYKIRCIYSILGKEITNYTVYIYGSGQPSAFVLAAVRLLVGEPVWS